MSNTPLSKQRAYTGLAVLLLRARVYTDSLGKYESLVRRDG
jgi:hypothetical protein